jgi:hypothetical protein
MNGNTTVTRPKHTIIALTLTPHTDVTGARPENINVCAAFTYGVCRLGHTFEKEFSFLYDSSFHPTDGQ